MRVTVLLVVVVAGVGCGGRAEPEVTPLPPAAAVTPSIPGQEAPATLQMPPQEPPSKETAPPPRPFAEAPAVVANKPDPKAEGWRKADAEVLKMWREGKSSEASTLLSKTIAGTRSIKAESLSQAECLAVAVLRSRYHHLLRQGTAPPDPKAVALLQQLAERGGIAKDDFPKWDAAVVSETRNAEAEGHRAVAFNKMFGTSGPTRVAKLKAMDAEIVRHWREGNLADGDNILADVLVGYRTTKPEDLSPDECKALATIYARSCRQPGDQETEDRIAKLAQRGGVAESELKAWRGRISAEAVAAIESTKPSEDARKKATEKVLAAVKKAKAILAEAAKGEEEETKKAMKIVEEDDGVQEVQLLKLFLEKDADPGLPIGDGMTLGAKLWAKGFKKKVFKYASAALGEKDVEDFFVTVFSRVNSDASAEDVVECVTRFVVASNKAKLLLAGWAKGDFDALLLANDPEAKALAKKFRGR